MVRLAIVALLVLVEAPPLRWMGLEPSLSKRATKQKVRKNTAFARRTSEVCSTGCGRPRNCLLLEEELCAKLSDDDAIAVVMKYLRLRPDGLTDHITSIVSASIATEFDCK